MNASLYEPLVLARGAEIPNRIAKAAMEENMAEDGQLPGERLFTLYRTWSNGGAGLLVTGNVMVHAEAMTGPAGVVLDVRTPLEPFREWARAAKSGGAKVWMQINHPGRQVKAAMPGVAWGPSAVKVRAGKASRMLAEPTAMTEVQIAETIERFAVTARRAEEAGFDGVEIHAAHGYLLSQFLSPLANQRGDRWGGPLENRARLLLDIVRAVRAAVRPGFTVAVKLNSADFQRGGFDADDALRVIEMLAPLGVDVVELSGGSYESPAMTGRAADSRTAAREAYFLELAAELAKTSPIPLMLTGGITRQDTANTVLANGIDIVGMGTAIAVTPDLPNRWSRGEEATRRLKPVTWSDKTLASAASMALVRYQMRQITQGLEPTARAHPLYALIVDQRVQRKALARYRKWLPTQPSDLKSPIALEDHR